MIRVGTVMPTYNQSEWLRSALDSFYAQDLGPHSADLVVVDDASTDETPGILAGYAASFPANTRVVRHEVNQRTAAAINTGVELLGGGYDALTWISSDNRMARDWVATLAEIVEAGAGAAYGGFMIRVPGRKPQYFFREHRSDGLEKDLSCYYGPAFLIRADVWREAGPHRGALAHDYDHWLRVEEACARMDLPIVGVDQSLCDYEAHDKRATTTRRSEFDAPHWNAEAKKRRGK